MNARKWVHAQKPYSFQALIRAWIKWSRRKKDSKDLRKEVNLKKKTTQQKLQNKFGELKQSSG